MSQNPYWKYYNLSMQLINQDVGISNSAVIYNKSNINYFSLDLTSKIEFVIKFIRIKYWNIYGVGTVMKIYVISSGNSAITNSTNLTNFQLIIYTFKTNQLNMNKSYIFKSIINYS